MGYVLKPIVRKITITGEDFSISFTEDQAEYTQDLIFINI